MWRQERKSVDHTNLLSISRFYKKTRLLLLDKDFETITRTLELPATTDINVTTSNSVITYEPENFEVLAGGVVRQPNTLSISAYILNHQIEAMEKYAKPGAVFYVMHTRPFGGLIVNALADKTRASKYQITGVQYRNEGFNNCISIQIEAVEIRPFKLAQVSEFVKSGSGSTGVSTKAPATEKEKEKYEGDFAD